MRIATPNGELNIPVKTIMLGVFGLVLLIMFFVFNPFVLIGAGERGVVMKLGQVQDQVLGEGMHYRTPFVDKVVKMDVQTQKYSAQVLTYSKDLQTADATIALNYHINPDSANKLWQETGKDYEERVIAPSVQEVVKQVSANYTAQELIALRGQVKSELKEQLLTRLGTYHLVVQDISIENFDFSNEYEKAIEEKQVAEQNAEKAKNDLERIKVEAEQTITTATAEAESIRIQGEALRENSGLVELRAVERWNGSLPTYTGGAIPFLNINQ